MNRPTDAIQWLDVELQNSDATQTWVSVLAYIDHLESLIVAWKNHIDEGYSEAVIKAAVPESKRLYDAAAAIEAASKPKTVEDVIGSALKRYSDDWDRWKVGEVADVDGLTEYIVNDLTEAGMLKDDA